MARIDSEASVKPMMLCAQARRGNVGVVPYRTRGICQQRKFLIARGVREVEGCSSAGVMFLDNECDCRTRRVAFGYSLLVCR